MRPTLLFDVVHSMLLFNVVQSTFVIDVVHSTFVIDVVCSMVRVVVIQSLSIHLIDDPLLAGSQAKVNGLKDI